MTTVIMLLAFPIGIFLLLQEKKSRIKYQAVFDDFYKETLDDDRLNDDTKLARFKAMLINNHYTVNTYENRVVGEKKLFSIGYMFIGIGTLYLGLIVYILYYLYLQKPHRVEFAL